MISRDDVFWAYRMLLGREPESEAVIAHYATELPTVQALRELFINSPEFQSSAARALAPRPPRPVFLGPAMQVETAATPDKLALLFDKVSAQWHHLGQTEPHWSVLTNDSYFQQNFQMNREAFYASGESELKMFDATLARAGIAPDTLARCVELGCGVGRATGPLAKRFAHVLALDISAAHLQVAQDYLLSEAIANVDCQHVAAVDDLAKLPLYDLMYSRIVLQHNPPPVMARLLQDFLSRLRPGGVAYFQLPTYKAGYRFNLDEYLQQLNQTHMEMHYFPQPALFALLENSGCKVLEFREDDAIGVSVTAVSNTVLVQKVAE